MICLFQKGEFLSACFRLVPTSVDDWFTKGRPCAIIMITLPQWLRAEPLSFIGSGHDLFTFRPKICTLCRCTTTGGKNSLYCNTHSIYDAILHIQFHLECTIWGHCEVNYVFLWVNLMWNQISCINIKDVTCFYLDKAWFHGVNKLNVMLFLWKFWDNIQTTLCAYVLTKEILKIPQ